MGADSLFFIPFVLPVSRLYLSFFLLLLRMEFYATTLSIHPALVILVAEFP